MPPRYAYWTIIIDNAPTAFRTRERDELLPTFHQILSRNPNATIKWFSRGRLWESPEEARRASEAAREPRDRDWRPGGRHEDPRARFKKKRDDRPRGSGTRQERREGPHQKAAAAPAGKSGQQRRRWESRPPAGDRKTQGSAGPPAHPKRDRKTGPSRGPQGGRGDRRAGQDRQGQRQPRRTWERPPQGAASTPARGDTNEPRRHPNGTHTEPEPPPPAPEPPPGPDRPPKPGSEPGPQAPDSEVIRILPGSPERAQPKKRADGE